MTGQPPPLVQRFLDKVGKSRDLSISLIVHVILVAIFGSAILFKVVESPKEIVTSSMTFVEKRETPPVRVAEDSPATKVAKTFTPMMPSAQAPVVVTTTQDMPLSIPVAVPAPQVPIMTEGNAPVLTPTTMDRNGLTSQEAKAIKQFSDWHVGGQKFEFTAYIGQYQGGNWNSTVQISQGKIETGSLPNLLYLMSHWTKDRVSTNYKNVQAIRLDSDELFTVKPPFIFLTGTRDFTLTEKEVENLRKYLRVGGCVWGDSSVPGKNSRFDIAFKREMRRVVGGDEDFAQLPAGHPIFSKAYFSNVKAVPPGLNSYQLPVTVLKMHGEIAVIYTANDYGDMWQVGLDSAGQIDLSRGKNGQYVAVNENLYSHREVYVRNLSPEALETSFKFGANVVMHLLTRWEDRLGQSTAL